MLDEDGRPCRDTLIEIWQANAAGRYIHDADRHDAPLDPNFFGAGRVRHRRRRPLPLRHDQARRLSLGQPHNAWRPNHIHLSLFGPTFATRLVTQMYFPGDPLLPLDPIFNGVPDEAARERLISAFSLDVTEPGLALGYMFDIVLRGREATPMEA